MNNRKTELDKIDQHTSSRNIDLDKINEHIADRNNVFYWQTDRAVDPEEAGYIWADRHRYFSDDELIQRVNDELITDELISIEPLDPEAQTNLGNVNSVRIAKMKSGKDVVVRCHPKGVKNGYFHAEALASQLTKDSGLPSYSTLAIHDFTEKDDFSFHLIEKLSGTAIKKFLENNQELENQILVEVGRKMAQLHQIHVDGFGPFDNEKAKLGKLVGLHTSLASSVQAGLDFNIKVLIEEKLFSNKQAEKLMTLFSSNNALLQSKKAVLVHNDFADWNLLTDGKNVTGILDWDEAVASDPISDIACWSTFFDPERMTSFLDGYWQVANKPSNFSEKFELLRLRYVLSKMTLRIRRFSWEKSESIKEKIEVGKLHLEESMKYFDI